jgi:hypothetical protein
MWNGETQVPICFRSFGVPFWALASVPAKGWV